MAVLYGLEFLKTNTYNYKNRVDIAAIGITDRDLGQRLKAFVVIKKDSNLNKQKILN